MRSFAFRKQQLMRDISRETGYFYETVRSACRRLTVEETEEALVGILCGTLELDPIAVKIRARVGMIGAKSL